MSLWTRIAAAFRGVPSKASEVDGGSVIERLRPWTVPPRRGSTELVRAYRTHPWLRSTANRVGSAVGRVELQAFRRGDRSKALAGHPLLDLLQRPVPVLSGRTQRRLTQVHYDLVGDAVWVKERNSKGQVVQVVPVPPHWFTSLPGKVDPTFRVTHNGVSRVYLPEDVVWFHDPDPDEPFGRGAGLGEALADELDTDEYASKYVKSFFFNFGMPEVMVAIEGADKAALTGLQTKWDAEHRGVVNSRRTLFTGGKLSAQRLDTTFKDSNLVELRQVERDTIIQVWGVPPEILGIIENSNRSTIESADYLMALYVTLPRLEDFCEAINAQLAPDFGDDVEIWFKNPVPEDRQHRLSVMQARPTAFTDNEVRAEAGFPPVEGKDTYPEPLAAGVTPYALGAGPGDLRSTRGLRAADGGSGLPESAIPGVLEALRPERLTAEVEPLMLSRLEAWGADQLAGLGASGKLDQLNPLLPRYVEQMSSTRIKGLVDTTTRERLRSSLVEGVRAGEDSEALGDRVFEVFAEAGDVRAEVIARTEVVGASNWATHEAQKVSGVVEKREWVATRDGRTRESHRELDGVQATLDEAFTVNGHSALFPGGFGVPEEDIQCRCTTVAIIEDPPEEEAGPAGSHRSALASRGKATLDECWRAYDEALGPWEADLRKALRRGFVRQSDDVMQALRKAAK